jgi:DNA-binding CsgD family transcriptional regulator/catechol 2,3-dioxygenase-like lactoylglutathione lyase family enzyme
MPRVAGPTRRGRPRHPDILTPAEWRVVQAVRHGLSNREIARRRGISLDAVKTHVATAIGKLGLANRTALRRWSGAPIDSAAHQEVRMIQATRTPASARVDALGPIGQVARRVRDVTRAEVWYRDVLGLTHLYTFPGPSGPLAFFDCGGTRLFLSQEGVESGGGQSLLYFRVADIQSAHDRLRQRGVEFVGAPHMIFKHADGTEEWMAFFRDCDGDLLAIMSQPGAPARSV